MNHNSLPFKKIRRLPRQPDSRQNRENRQNRKICSFPNIRQPKPIFRMQSTPYGERQASRRIIVLATTPLRAAARAKHQKVLLGGNATNPVHSWENGSWLPPRGNSAFGLRDIRKSKRLVPMRNFRPHARRNEAQRPGERRFCAGLEPSHRENQVLRGGKECDAYSLVFWLS